MKRYVKIENRLFFYIRNIRKHFHSKNFKKQLQTPCIHEGFVLFYYGAVKTAIALMQEVATRSVALPRNARRFSCGASLLS